VHWLFRSSQWAILHARRDHQQYGLSGFEFGNCFLQLLFRVTSILYRNSKSGLEQDLLLEESPGITPEDLGFSTSTRVELFTEFLPDTPLPELNDSSLRQGQLAAQLAGLDAAVSSASASLSGAVAANATPLPSVSFTDTNASRSTIYLRKELSAEVRSTMVEPDFTDHNLTFGGKMRMGAGGRAFCIGQGAPGERRETVPVGKRFEAIQDGGSERRVLIEAVEYQKATPLLRMLPVSPNRTIITNAALLPRTTNLLARSSSRVLPPKRLAQASSKKILNSVMTADAKIGASGHPPVLVWDYELLDLDGYWDPFVFRSGTSYLCSGVVNFFSSVVFQGSTVVKYAPYPDYAVLQFYGTVEFQTEPLRPAVFIGSTAGTCSRTTIYLIASS
jgi:hypothetical protein